MGPGGPILALAAWTGLLLSPSFLAGKAAWALSGCLPTESADYCMLVNECAWLRSRVCLLGLEVDLGSVLESELGQIWKYGALKACSYILKLVSSEKNSGFKGITMAF